MTELEQAANAYREACVASDAAQRREEAAESEVQAAHVALNRARQTVRTSAAILECVATGETLKAATSRLVKVPSSA